MLIALIILMMLVLAGLLYIYKHIQYSAKKKQGKIKKEEKNEIGKPLAFYGVLYFSSLMVAFVIPVAGWRMLFHPYITYTYCCARL